MSERLYNPNLFLIIDLLAFAKLLELLAIDHSSSTFRREAWQLSGCILVVDLDYQSTKVFPLIDSTIYIIYFVNYHTNKLNKYETKINETHQ